MMARYQALGLNADDGAFAVEADASLNGSGVSVAFRHQLDLGDIRYTTDGSAPTPTSKQYSGPFSVAMPVRVRAATFAGPQRLSRELDQTFDRISATRRTSQQLELCTEQVPLNLPGRKAAAGGSGPVYLIDIRNPCWIYRGVNLSAAHHIAVRVAALPFNYQFANEPGPEKLPYPAPQAELVVRRGCDGPPIARATLAKAARDGEESEIVAAIQTFPQLTDLCMTLARPTLNPLWALGWVELRP
jgi:hexosaminidase